MKEATRKNDEVKAKSAFYKIQNEKLLMNMERLV
jgi:hypothetical protein